MIDRLDPGTTAAFPLSEFLSKTRQTGRYTYLSSFSKHLFLDVFTLQVLLRLDPGAFCDIARHPVDHIEIELALFSCFLKK